MMELQGKSVFHKVWYFLRTYLLTLGRFDLCLQGSLLLVVLLETNVFLLLRRDAGTGYLRALIEDWVFIGTGGAEFLFGAVLAWFGRNRRQFALSGWLFATAASSLIVLAFPYAESNPPIVELCGGEPISAYSQRSEDPLATPRVAFLIITAMLCSVTMIAIWAHGLTYLDDHEPQSGPYFYGILISIRLSLGLSGRNWLRPGAVRDDWWVAHLTLSLLVLTFAGFFTLFPKRMHNWKEVEILDDTGFFATFGRVVRNKTIVLQTLAYSLLHTALFGFVEFDNSVVQAKFHIESLRQDPRTSRAVSDLFRSMVVIFFVMIFRVRFSVRRRDGVKANTASKVGGVVAIFVAIFLTVVTVLPCDVDDIGGTIDGLIEQPTCSQDCGCNSASYGFTPVCALDTSVTYFSPCDAGCRGYEDLNGILLFHNCTCGSERAIRGSCTITSCRTTFGFYQIFYTLVLALSGASFTMQGMVILRAVRRYDKPIALGASFAVIGLLAQGPGHLLYLLISHLACALKGVEGGACVFHRPTLWVVPAVSAVLALLSGIVSILTSKTVPRSKVVVDSDDDSR